MSNSSNTSTSDTVEESTATLYLSVELDDTTTDLFMAGQKLLSEEELSAVKDSGVVTRTLHQSNVWAPLAAAICQKANFIRKTYVGWDRLGYIEKESDRGKMGRIHIDQREELNALKDMRVVKKSLETDQQEMTQLTHQLFPLPHNKTSNKNNKSKVLITSSSSSTKFQAQKSVNNKLLVDTVFGMAARKRRNVLERLNAQQIKNIASAEEEIRRRRSVDSYVESKNNGEEVPCKTVSLEDHEEVEVEEEILLSLPSMRLLESVTTTISLPETLVEESDYQEATAPLSAPPPLSESQKKPKRKVQIDGNQEKGGLAHTGGGGGTSNNGNEEGDDEEQVKSKETSKKESEDDYLSQSQQSLIQSMMTYEEEYDETSCHLRKKHFVRVSSESANTSSCTNFFRQSIASPDFSDSPICNYTWNPLSNSDHTHNHTHQYSPSPNLTSIPEGPVNGSASGCPILEYLEIQDDSYNAEMGGATPNVPFSLPLDDPLFNEYCQQLDHPPTREDYAAFKIQQVGQMIDEKYGHKLNEAMSLIMKQAMEQNLLYSEFSRVSRWLSLQAKKVQERTLLVTWLGCRLYEKLPDLEKTINEYTTLALEDVTLFGSDWIGDDPRDNPEMHDDLQDNGLTLPPLKRSISAEVLLEEVKGEVTSGTPLSPRKRLNTPPLSYRENSNPSVLEVASPNEVKERIKVNRNKPSESRPMIISISSQSSFDSVCSSVRTIGSTTGGRNSSLADIRETNTEENVVFNWSSPSPPVPSTGGEDTREEEEEGGGNGERIRKTSGQVVASVVSAVAAAFKIK